MREGRNEDRATLGDGIPATNAAQLLLAHRTGCGKCGAVRQDSQLGLEPTPEEYVANMVAVFREVRRVLRDDGTCWVNLGDCYNGSGSFNGWNGSTPEPQRTAGQREKAIGIGGLKPKDLVGIPWRVAFALQADGWYLRSDIIWAKPNPMPESVTDRPTKAHEYLFLLSKRPTYFYDAEAVREPNSDNPGGMAFYARKGLPMPTGPRKKQQAEADPRINAYQPGAGVEAVQQYGRNLRSVWSIATQPYPGAHFATFPEALVEPCVKAGTSERGVCPECGAPWRRVVERGESHYAQIKGDRTWQEMEAVSHSRGEITNVQTRTTNGTVPSLRAATSSTTGWQPSCSCVSGVRRRSSASDEGHDGSTDTADLLLSDMRQDAVRRVAASGLPAGLSPVPSVVLDPFAGSGTTGRVAQRLGRRAVLIDLSAEYLTQAMTRNADIPLGLETA